MEGHSQLANCVCGKTMALFKPWRYLVSKPPNLDVAKEAGILCDGVISSLAVSQREKMSSMNSFQTSCFKAL